MERKIFTIEGTNICFEGYTDGSKWNGWEKPYFTQVVADKIADEFELDYSDDSECYISQNEDESDSDSYYEHTVIEVNGKTTHVYAIGRGDWMWDAYPLSDFTEINGKTYYLPNADYLNLADMDTEELEEVTVHFIK
jgi:hypothetical protein